MLLSMAEASRTIPTSRCWSEAGDGNDDDDPGSKLDAMPSTLSCFFSLVALDVEARAGDAPLTLPVPAVGQTPDADAIGRSSTSSVLPRPIFFFHMLRDVVNWKRASATMEIRTKCRHPNLTARTRGVADGWPFVVAS